MQQSRLVVCEELMGVSNRGKSQDGHASPMLDGVQRRNALRSIFRRFAP